MLFEESIKKAKERGADAAQILEEIKKQNPSKKESIEDALRKGFTPAQIIDEIIKRTNISPAAESPAPAAENIVKPDTEAELDADIEKKFQEAKQRIESLKKKRVESNTAQTETIEKNPEKTTPVSLVSPQQNTIEIEKEKEEIRKTILKRLKNYPGETTGGPVEKTGNKTMKNNITPVTPANTTLETPPEINIISPLPKKPTLWEKLWVRVVIFVLIIVFLVGNLTFWYWYFRIRTQPPVENPPAAQPNTPQNPGPTPNTPATVSAPLFQTDTADRTIKISKPEELSAILRQVLQETMPSNNKFQRIIIENTTDKKFLGLKDFLSALLIRTPDNFYQNLGDNFTLFIFSQREGNKLGFVSEIKNYQGFPDLLKNEEITIESDFQPFFSLTGQKDLGITSYFRNASTVTGYSGPNFRYKTLASNDLGICYLVSGNYFILTSSWQSMETIVGKMNLAKERIEIASELKLGSRGTEVELLQKWLLQDPTVYMGRITGYFGTATQQAVIKFQKKYENEILTPQGKTEGTGVVDEYTRMKLNELYGESGVKPSITELKKTLQYGDSGQEVTLLQTWLSQDRTLYPAGIKISISGYFGPITKNAVISFQKKYSINNGTGIVDGPTLQKLNDLYSKK